MDRQTVEYWVVFLKAQVSVVCYQYSHLCESVVDVDVSLMIWKGTTPWRYASISNTHHTARDVFLAGKRDHSRVCIDISLQPDCIAGTGRYLPPPPPPPPPPLQPYWDQSVTHTSSWAPYLPNWSFKLHFSDVLKRFGTERSSSCLIRHTYSMPWFIYKCSLDAT